MNAASVVIDTFDVDGRAALKTARAAWLSNLGALYQRIPDLAARLDALPFAQLPRVEAARDGTLTVRLIADDGAPVFAHSRHEPLVEAGRTASRAAAAAGNPAFVVQGGGLGHVWAALEAVAERPVVIACEPDLAVLKAALCAADHAAAIREGRLVFITQADKRLVHDTLTAMNADVMLGLQFVTLPPASRCGAEFHARIRALVTDYIAFARMQITTLVRNARQTCRNITLNLRDYVRSPGIESLRNRAAGVPAILVAAGPSLAAHLDALPALRERAVIIAVQTVYKLLCARGCPPHFVTSLDYHELSGDFFRDPPPGADACGTLLIAEPKAHPSVLDAFSGPRRLLHSPFAHELLCERPPIRAALRAGSTVAHLSLYLAQHLGCDPIIFVGQDLCCTDGLYYPPGTPIEDVWRPELSRFCTVEMKQWERIARSRSILRRVTDSAGRPAYSDEQLFTYAEQFEADIAASAARVLLAAPTGVALAGAQVRPLADIAAQYCQRPLPADLLRDAGDMAADDAGAAAASIEARIREIRELRRISERMLGLLDELAGLTDRPAEFNRRIALVDDLRAQVARCDRAFRLVTEASQLAELRRFSADRQIGGDSPEHDSPQTALRRLRRDGEFVAAIRDGCDFLLDLLPQALDRLRGGGATR
ncbi:MAG: DUF115 domain-containing protein [Phycisphaerales bacterium]|nr:DUF115 domain-containing protein [Phycisphaerales bacterium]